MVDLHFITVQTFGTFPSNAAAACSVPTSTIITGIPSLAICIALSSFPTMPPVTSWSAIEVSGKAIYESFETL
jgi:hypothetical protein